MSRFRRTRSYHAVLYRGCLEHLSHTQRSLNRIEEFRVPTRYNDITTPASFWDGAVISGRRRRQITPIASVVARSVAAVDMNVVLVEMAGALEGGKGLVLRWLGGRFETPRV